MTIREPYERFYRYTNPLQTRDALFGWRKG